MFLIKFLVQLIISAFFAAAGMTFFPSFSGLCAFLIVAIIIPLPLWNGLMKKCFGGARPAAVILLIVLAISTMPKLPATPSADTPYTPPATPPVATPAETGPAATEETEAATVPEETTTATEPEATQASTEPATTEPTHVHIYTVATCTAPMTCSCGATEGTPLDHDWKDATFSAAKTCRECGVTEGEPQEIPGKANYNGHVYTGGDYSEKYHYEANCPGKNSHEITWEDVDRMGLGPCGTCVLK